MAQNSMCLRVLREHDIVYDRLFEQVDAHIHDDLPQIIFEPSAIKEVGGRWRKQPGTDFATILKRALRIPEKEAQPELRCRFAR